MICPCKQQLIPYIQISKYTNIQISIYPYIHISKYPCIIYIYGYIAENKKSCFKSDRVRAPPRKDDEELAKIICRVVQEQLFPIFDELSGLSNKEPLFLFTNQACLKGFLLSLEPVFF